MSDTKRELSPALSLLGAALVHALVIGAAASLRAPKHGASGVSLPPIEIDVSIDAPRAVAAVVPAGPDQSEAGSVAERRASAGRSALPLGHAESEQEATPEPAPAPELRPALPTPRRTVDLGLGGGIARRMLLDRRRVPDQQPAPSPGLLQEGLDERAAARGSARSAAAISAAFGSAALGPKDGSAVFEVTADRRGNVISVTVVSFGSSDARWTAVAADLRRRLQKRKLRVPPGAAGLSARVRIERGVLATEVPSRQKTRRGVALGQDSLGPKDVRDESTRASFDPGRISPTSRIGGSGAGAHPTRVVLLSERLL